MITDEFNDKVVETAIDFVKNVESKLVYGSGELHVKNDESYRELRIAVINLLGKLERDQEDKFDPDHSNTKPVY